MIEWSARARPVQADCTLMVKFHRLLGGLVLIAMAVLGVACGDTGDLGETSAAFEVEGSVATMTGVIDSSTPDAVRILIEDYPELTTISLVDVPGSADDEANIAAARLVRSSGLSTHVPADGEIASGGVDFFLAGTGRSFDEGAQFGVHSWAAGDGTAGIDVPADDVQHRLYLDYYAEVGIDEAFYWFTLEAAPADDIHWMTSGELATYGFATGAQVAAG